MCMLKMNMMRACERMNKKQKKFIGCKKINQQITYVIAE